VIEAAIAGVWLLHALHWLSALRSAGRSAAAAGEWRRELALRAGMVGLVVAAVATPPAVDPDLPLLSRILLLAVFAAGHAVALAGRSALNDAWGIGTRPRRGGPVNRRGIYRRFRHPIYTGVSVALAAQLALRPNVPGVLLLLAALTVALVKIRAEERWLAG
jgi:protein-S-isoprenylcysteine O-methyltransferase Ste14